MKEGKNDQLPIGLVQARSSRHRASCKRIVGLGHLHALRNPGGARGEHDGGPIGRSGHRPGSDRTVTKGRQPGILFLDHDHPERPAGGPVHISPLRGTDADRRTGPFDVTPQLDLTAHRIHRDHPCTQSDGCQPYGYERRAVRQRHVYCRAGLHPVGDQGGRRPVHDAVELPVGPLRHLTVRTLEDQERAVGAAVHGRFPDRGEGEGRLQQGHQASP